MKLSAVLLALVLPLTIQAAPAAQEAETTDVQAEGASLGLVDFDAKSKRGPVTCTILGDGVRYRKCPSTNTKKCPAIGQYRKGQRVTFTCGRKGTVVKGNPYVVPISPSLLNHLLIYSSCYKTVCGPKLRMVIGQLPTILDLVQMEVI